MGRIHAHGEHGAPFFMLRYHGESLSLGSTGGCYEFSSGKNEVVNNEKIRGDDYGAMW